MYDIMPTQWLRDAIPTDASVQGDVAPHLHLAVTMSSADLARPAIVVPDYLKKEPTRHGAAWAMSKLHSRRAPDRLNLQIIDTVILSGSEPVWLFTNKHGYVVRKSSAKATPERISAMLQSFAAESGSGFGPLPNARDAAAAVVVPSAAANEKITEDDADTTSKEAEPAQPPVLADGYAWVEYSNDADADARLVSAADAVARLPSGLPACDMVQPYLRPSSIKSAHANFRHRWT